MTEWTSYGFYKTTVIVAVQGDKIDLVVNREVANKVRRENKCSLEEGDEEGDRVIVVPGYLSREFLDPVVYLF